MALDVARRVRLLPQPPPGEEARRSLELSSQPLQLPSQADVEVLDLAQVLSMLGRGELAAEAARVCSMSTSHRLWCSYLAATLTGRPAEKPATPMPGEVQRLYRKLRGEQVLDRGKRLEELSKAAEKMAELLREAMLHGRARLGELAKAVQAIKHAGDGADAAKAFIEAARRYRLPDKVAKAAAKTLRELASGDTPPEQAAEKLAVIALKSRAKKPAGSAVDPREGMLKSQEEMSRISQVNTPPRIKPPALRKS